MDLLSIAAVFIGAGLGALLRWGVGLVLNPVFPNLPLGTLAANLGGSLLMGIAIGMFAQFQTMPPPLRLAIATGFLGGLTTFSAFSAETVSLLLRQQYAWTTLIVIAHVLGSLLATLLGIGLVRLAFAHWA